MKVLVSLVLSWLMAGCVLAAEPESSRPAAVAASLTTAQMDAARTMVTNRCTVCHTIGKAMRKDPELMKPHMRQKAKLTDGEIQMAVPYLAAERRSAGKSATPSVSRDSERRKGDRRRRHDDDDDDDDEHEGHEEHHR